MGEGREDARVLVYGHAIAGRKRQAVTGLAATIRDAQTRRAAGEKNPS